MTHASVPVTTLREGIDATTGTERLEFTHPIESAISGDP
jgi:hypothetical protein